MVVVAAAGPAAGTGSPPGPGPAPRFRSTPNPAAAAVALPASTRPVATTTQRRLVLPARPWWRAARSSILARSVVRRSWSSREPYRGTAHADQLGSYRPSPRLPG